MPNSPFRLIPADSLGDLPPTESLGGTHLVARGLNVIFGASGTYKSFYTLDLALTLAQSVPIVYVAAEGVGGLCRRVQAWREYRELELGQLHFICQEVNLLKTPSVVGLIKSVEAIKPAMVIFDTYARCIPGGDENNSKDCGVAVHHSAMIQQEVGAAVTWIHHTNRAERGERGSGAMRGAADTMIEMSINGDGIVRVECSKIKDDEMWPTETYRFRKVGDSGVLVPAATAQLDADHLTSQQAAILELLALPVFTQAGAETRQITSAVNISYSTVYRVLSNLKERGYITQDRRGDPFFISDKGSELLYRKAAKSRFQIVQG